MKRYIVAMLLALVLGACTLIVNEGNGDIEANRQPVTEVGYAEEGSDISERE